LSDPGGFGLYETTKNTVQLFDSNGSLHHTVNIPGTGTGEWVNEIKEIYSDAYQIDKNRKFYANLHGVAENWGGMGEIGYIKIDAEPTTYYRWEKHSGSVSEMGDGLYVSFNPLDNTGHEASEFLVIEPKKRLRKLVLTNAWLQDITNNKKINWTSFNEILRNAKIDVVEFKGANGQCWGKLISMDSVSEVRKGTIEDIYRSGAIKDMKTLKEAEKIFGIKNTPWLREHFPIVSKAIENKRNTTRDECLLRSVTKTLSF
jgi:hypothetical protein